jgi:hypothetical protein
MLRITILCCCLFSSVYLSAQTINKRDTSKTIEPFTKTMYVRCMPLGIYTGAGYLQNRITQNIEIGKSFGMIDAGIAYGKTAIQDTAGNGTNYLEAKVTMDVCQYGLFSNEMTIGAGGVINSKNYLMLEISYTIYGQFWKRCGIGIVTGYYDYSGNTTDASHNMFGLYIRYGLLRPENGGLINIGRMARTHMHR